MEIMILVLIKVRPAECVNSFTDPRPYMKYLDSEVVM